MDVAITVEVSAAVARLSATLAPLITTAQIESAASSVGLRRYLDGSNKAAKLGSLLVTLLDDGRRWGQAENLVVSLTMQAHERSARGTVVMTEGHVDSIVADMRSMGLRPGDLSRKSWRTALHKQSSPAAPPGMPTGITSPGPVSHVRPVVHTEALECIRQLLDPSTSPQQRGRQLELIVFGILQVEKLAPERNVTIPGEQMDSAFLLEGHHYLVECKWEATPIGLPPLESFASKVSRKAEGTFGVLLSMSGFVGDINEKASRGARLNCIGVAHAQFMNVVEGRGTWSDMVRKARRLASTRSIFWSA